MMEFLRHLFSEPDNQTWCMVKILIFIGSIAYIFYAGVHVYHNHSFDPQAYGIGFGALLAGGGGSLLMKPDSEKSGKKSKESK